MYVVCRTSKTTLQRSRSDFLRRHQNWQLIFDRTHRTNEPEKTAIYSFFPIRRFMIIMPGHIPVMAAMEKAMAGT